MYRKKEFEPRERAEVEALIRNNPFGMLITITAGAPEISHLAFVYEAERGKLGTLVSHLAAPNPQAAAIRAGDLATISFRGVHGYISPSWLSDRSHTAPTWNYETVECRGRLRELDERKQAIKSVALLVNQEEQLRPDRWRMGELGAEGIDRRLPKIVCFELEIQQWQAKFKMHQDELPIDTVEACPHLRAERKDELADRMESYNRERIARDKTQGPSG